MNVDQEMQRQYQKAFKENQALREVLDTHAKEARKILRMSGNWHQDYDGNEIVGIMAIYMATRKALLQKQEALDVAIKFIGVIEALDHEQNENALEALELINQILAGESIDETIARIDSRETH